MLCLQYAESMTALPVEIDDDLFANLQQHFTEAQLVELTAVIAWENFRARFNHAFGLESDGYYQGRTQLGTAVQEPANESLDHG